MVGFTQVPTTPNGTEADLIYIASSSLSQTDQFRYILEMRDATNTPLVKIKQPPNDNGLGLFEVSNILNDYMDYDKPFKINNIIYSDNNNIRDFSIVGYYESGSSPSSSVEENIVGAVSSSITVIPAVEERNTAFNWQTASYWEAGLSDQPETLYVRNTDYGSMSHLNIGTSIPGLVSIFVFREDGSQLALRIFPNTVIFIPGPQTENQKLIHAPYGPANFKNDGILNILSGNDWGYYKWQWRSPTASIWKEYIVRRLPSCNEENGARLAFINTQGVFDYYTFTLTRTNRESYENQTYRQTFIPYETVNNTLVFDSTRRGETLYNKNIDVTETVTSDWLTQAEADWLIQLFESPSVFKQDGDNFIPVIITNSSIDLKTNPRGQKVYNLTAEYRFAHPKKSRR
jgi:hypothetical protein